MNGCSTLPRRKQLTRPAILERKCAGCSRTPRAIDALVDGFAAQWLNLRRVERGRRRSRPLSDLRRESAAGVRARNGALHREHAARGSQRRRAAERRLHVRQRAARPALRNSRDLRQPIPESRADRTPLSAAACSHTDRVLATTSYPDRTSPVLRGKFLLNNILGLPSPPPPPGVDTNLAEVKPTLRRRRFESDWRSTAPTRAARAATR